MVRVIGVDQCHHKGPYGREEGQSQKRGYDGVRGWGGDAVPPEAGKG